MMCWFFLRLGLQSWSAWNPALQPTDISGATHAVTPWASYRTGFSDGLSEDKQALTSAHNTQQSEQSRLARLPRPGPAPPTTTVSSPQCAFIQPAGLWCVQMTHKIRQRMTHVHIASTFVVAVLFFTRTRTHKYYAIKGNISLCGIFSFFYLCTFFNVRLYFSPSQGTTQ